MSGLSTRKIRTALVALAAENDGQVCREELAIRLNVDGLNVRPFYLNTMNRLLRNGEIKSVDGSLYRYVAEHAPSYSYAENWARVYRAVRIAKGVFDRPQIRRVSAVSETSVCQALKYMLEIGYIVEASRKGLKVFYKGTKLLRNTPEVPEAPKKELLPMFRARQALAELNRVFLTMDITKIGARKLITEQLNSLQQEFKKGGNDDSGKD